MAEKGSTQSAGASRKLRFPKRWWAVGNCASIWV